MAKTAKMTKQKCEEIFRILRIFSPISWCSHDENDENREAIRGLIAELLRDYGYFSLANWRDNLIFPVQNKVNKVARRADHHRY